MAFGGVDAVKIIGGKELRRELKQINDGLPKSIRAINKEISEDVATKAQAAASGAGGAAAKSAPSIRAGGTQKSAYISFGGKQYPFALGAEFGSVRYKQFKPWRGNAGGAGYFLYPTIRSQIPHVKELAEKKLNQLVESLGTNPD